ncbi:MAG: DUF427 domain-containing protein [Chloroflexi bacterium]|nr:DUF427 domain-containing protein [Chloroflexota bacterium]
MARATWNGKVIAESDQVILVEGNLYFPPESVNQKYLRKSDKQYRCPWKGLAGYYDIVVDSKVNKDAAWHYYQPSEAAMTIKDYVAFDKSLGIQVEGTPARRLDRPA